MSTVAAPYPQGDAPHPRESAPQASHQALVYGSDEAFLAAMVPFCRSGVEAGDTVLAVTTRSNVDLLLEELGEAARHVEFVDADDWCRTPGPTLGAYRRYVEQYTARGRARRLRVISEPVWHGRALLEASERTRYESALDAAFTDRRAHIVCLYDTRTLPEAVVADVRRTHPAPLTGPRSTAPGTGRGPRQRPLEPVPADGEEAVMRFGRDLSAVRAFVTEAATALGMPDDRTRRLVFAVNEVATNALQHGAEGKGRVTVRRCGSRVVCDVTSPCNTAGLDWYAGYLPPDPAQRRGHGLWAVRQLCDAMEVGAGSRETTVRLHVTLP
ncbi:histidine kinase-like protein [Streptomyces sp. BK208]|uniref:sensor histidine kinase n=1 Tax=Streptomyces sp. BK208 TaxID=2512150 RepID=UPI001061D6D7|nr:sensor histidine kinase [Streptomyces sp. BK208]TDT29258.1 histidine kinase-like protein [Streptomyces sp. BK208]